MKIHDKKKAREYTLQALYQWSISNENPVGIETQFRERYKLKLYDCRLDYFKTLFYGVIKNIVFLDAKIKKFSSQPLPFITLVELSILRLSIYELLKTTDTPIPVVISEGVMLSKKFGSVKGYKFINGFLDKISLETIKK